MNTEETKRLEFILVNRKDLKEELKESLIEFLEEFKEEKVWVTQEVVKEILSIKSSTTIQSLRDNGLIEFTQPLKKLILYKKSSVMEYLEKHSHKTF
jgi:NADH:ubiquinone oxidoreductase subunit E